MRIAVDAMGGDTGPSVVVPGAIQGARLAGASLILVGRTAEIEDHLSKVDRTGLEIEVLEAPDVIEMDEHPAQAARKKPHSSIAIALGAVKSGRADAMVSAGNSG